MFGVIFFNYYINGAPKCNEYIHLARAPICKEYIHLARAHKCYRESTFSYGLTADKTTTATFTESIL